MQLALLQSSSTPAPGSWEPPRELPSLAGVTRVSIDTETDGLHPFRNKVVGASVAYRTDSGIQAVYLPWGHPSGNLDPELVRRWMLTELRGKQAIFKNAKFDLHMLQSSGIDLEGVGVRPEDVTFADALLDDNRIGGRKLEDLGQRYCGAGKVVLPFPSNQIARRPSSAIGPYAEQDARLTLMIDEAVAPLIRREELADVLQLENDLIYAVCHIERAGSRIDVPKLERWRGEARAELQRLLLEIHRETGAWIEPMSPGSLLSFCHHVRVKPPVERTDSGKVSFTDETVAALSAFHPVFEKVSLARRIQSLLSKFLDKFWEGLDGDILRSQYHQLQTDEKSGTVSGRFSCTGGGDDTGAYCFNAQQTIKPSAQKKDGTGQWTIRELFIPGEGYTFFNCDAKQIEYRLFGHFSGAKHIIEGYNNDPLIDMHARVTALATPFAPELAAQWGEKFRDHVKNVNFARLYGAQEERIAEMLGISREDARAFIAVLDKVFPEAEPLLRRSANQAKDRGYVTTVLGRRARFPKGDRGDYRKQTGGAKKVRGIHSAVNRIIQGTAADIMKLKMRRVYEERHTVGIEAIRMSVHDELDGDLHPDPSSAEMLKELLNEQELKLKVPILWDFGVGQNWLEAK